MAAPPRVKMGNAWTLRVQFPEEFKKVMVVSYRPSQVWVEARTASASIRF